MPRSSDPPSAAEPLPEQLLQDAAATFGMLAATARLQIVWLLASGERDVTTLATEIGGTVAAVSQHLAKLKLAGLVHARREGRRQVYVVDDPHVVETVRQVVHHHEELRTLPRGRFTRSAGA
nr:metalloregulator ArsR/SmtB family transcription factor [Solihabitans fulvus]